MRCVASPDAEQWSSIIERGLVRISTVTLLEVGYSARTADELREGNARPPLASIPVEYLTPSIEDRAVEVQTLLAQRGEHRAAAIPHLLITASAELAQLTVLHVDKDYELIAAITNQAVERLRLSRATHIMVTRPETHQSSSVFEHVRLPLR